MTVMNQGVVLAELGETAAQQEEIAEKDVVEKEIVEKKTVRRRIAEQAEAERQAEKARRDAAYRQAQQRWQRRNNNVGLEKAAGRAVDQELRAELLSMSGATIELNNSERDLLEIVSLANYGDTRGLDDKGLKDYGVAVKIDRVHDNTNVLTFSQPVMVLPTEESGKTYDFAGDMIRAYQETICTQAGRQYDVYLLDRELADGSFWLQCDESDVALRVEKVGSQWKVRLVLPNTITGKTVQDFTMQIKRLKEAKQRSLHPPKVVSRVLTIGDYYDD